MIYNKLLLTLVFTISISVLMGTQNAFAATITDAGNIPEPSQTVDFSQFTGDFSADCPDVFEGDFCRTDGPIQVGDLVFEDIIWSSTSVNSLIGNGFYGLDTLNGNGFWDSGRNGYVGTNAAAVTVVMRFDFNDGAVCAVGGFVNYAPDLFPDPFVIRALDNGNAVLETFDVRNDAPIDTPLAQNDGAFRGIVRASNDIAAIELTGEFDVLDDLKFSRNCGVVGGEFLPIETTSLLLAAASSPAAWLTSLTIVALGIGVYVFTRNPSNIRNIKVILRDYLDRL